MLFRSEAAEHGPRSLRARGGGSRDVLRARGAGHGARVGPRQPCRGHGAERGFDRVDHVVLGRGPGGQPHGRARGEVAWVELLGPLDVDRASSALHDAGRELTLFVRMSSVSAVPRKLKSLSVSDSLVTISTALSQQLPKKERKLKGKFYTDSFTGEKESGEKAKMFFLLCV